MSTCIRILLVLLAFLSVNVIADHRSNRRGCVDKEREALLKFKNGVADHNRRLSSWEGDDCCAWIGVFCHNVTGHVIELSLSAAGIVGDIPPYLGNLSNLRVLDISMNKLSRNIPEELTELKGLQSLNLSRNFLQGPIPDKIGELRNLESLDLSRNRLSGVIPPSLSAITFLGYLDLSNNNLSGKIPYAGQLTTFGNSSYIGNEKLCGPPLSKKCPGDHETDLQTHWDPEE